MQRVPRVGFVLFAVAAALASSVHASGVASGELQASDFGSPPTPLSYRGITMGRWHDDLSFGFLVPQKYTAIHIMWSVGGIWRAQEEYATGTQPEDFIEVYTIHHTYEHQVYGFKFQGVIKSGNVFPFDKDVCGPWYFTGTLPYQIVRPLATPPPAPAPAPPPAPPPPPAAPAPVNAVRMHSGEPQISVLWPVVPHAEWYVVERRTGLGPLVEGPGSTPWADISGKIMANTDLHAGRHQLLVHYPVLPGGMKNIFRVIAYNAGGHATSAAVAEHAPMAGVALQTPKPSMHGIIFTPSPTPSPTPFFIGRDSLLRSRPDEVRPVPIQ